MTDIAIFPIPNCIVFPGTVMPLHVFEPRYRKMIQYCVDTGMSLGVSHVEKLVHAAKKNQPIEVMLKSNQATYKPVSVCSAGRCELIETLRDGRLLINLHAEKRYRLVKEKQSLPFIICQGDEYSDLPLSAEEVIKIEELKDKLLHRLIALTKDKPPIQSILSSEPWQTKNPTAFSFELFALLQTDAEIMQHILEMVSAEERLDTALSLLSQIPAQI